MTLRRFRFILVILALLPHVLFGAAAGSTVLCTDDTGHAAIEISHTSCTPAPPADGIALTASDDCTDAEMPVADVPYPSSRAFVPLWLPASSTTDALSPAHPLHARRPAFGLVLPPPTLTALRTIHLLV